MSSIKHICFITLFFTFVTVWRSVNGAERGLPFTENFSSVPLIDETKTTVEVRSEEQAVRLAQANRRFGVFTDPLSFDISSDQDHTLALTVGDVDGDGDLDLVTANLGVNKLYPNTGLNEAPFANSVGIPIADDNDETRSIALGDIDGDGDLDVVAGNSLVNDGTPNRLYMNNGSPNPFTSDDAINISDDSDQTHSVALGDIDGDGDLDVVTGSDGVNRLYLNNGTPNPFTGEDAINISNDAHRTFSIKLGDVDGDGDLDVIVGNWNQPNRLYLNNLNSDGPSAQFVGHNISNDANATHSLALGDVNGDGDLDVIVGNRGVNRLYLNDGSDNPFETVKGSDITDDNDTTRSIALGDVDGDGDLDLVVGNFANTNRLYLNTGEEQPFANTPAIDISDDADATRSIALRDMDGDGDLDVIAGNGSQHNRLYLNRGNANPFAGVEEGINLSDDAGASSVALGDVNSDGHLDVVAGILPVFGGAPNRLYLNDGVDNPFPTFAGDNISDDADATRSVVLGDMDGDGDLDIVAGNRDEFNRQYRNNCKKTPADLNNCEGNPFTTGEAIIIPNSDDRTLAIALGDMDGDRDLDIVTGNDGVNRLYLSGLNSDAPPAEIAVINITEDTHDTRSIAVGDMDGDGDLDVVVGNADQPNRLYLNNLGADDLLADFTGTNITGDTHDTRSIAVADMDGDGDLDIVVGNRDLPNRLYLNNGSRNPFTEAATLNITDDTHFTRSIVLGDMDGDGHNDVVAGNWDQPNRLYLNNGTSDPFANVLGLDITDDEDDTRGVALGDVDDDGDLDVVVGNQGAGIQLYLNSRASRPSDSSGDDYQTHRGSVVSLEVDNRTEPILSATLTATADVPKLTSIIFYLSNNDGQTWYLVQSGEPFSFPTTGSHLRWKAELHSLSPVITPVLTEIAITGNSAPTDIILDETFLAENQNVGTLVGTFKAVDKEGGGHTYSLVSGFGSGDNTQFTIDGDMLKSNAVFDFENEQNKTNYSIRVRATEDSDSGYVEKQFTIGVSDANDPPTEILLDGDEIAENFHIGSLIGFLSARDQDSGAEDVHFFSLPSGTPDNAHFFIEDNELKAGRRFDFEERNHYMIQVRVTDSGGETFEKEFAIMIRNVNDAATIQVISSPPELPKDVGFGKNTMVEVFVKADDQENVNGLTRFKFLGPEGITHLFDRQTAQGATAPVFFTPNAAGDWELTVHWLGNDDVDNTTTMIPFITSPSDSILELFFLDVIQVVGQPRTIPGRLRIINENPGKVDLSGREITITIHHPIHDFPLVFNAKTDSRGNFEVRIPEDFFDVEGEWKIEAEFVGDRDLNASSIEEGNAIVVRQKPGYAILVLGSVKPGVNGKREGLEEHGNTINFVRETFEDAGFDTNPADADIKVLLHNTPNPKDTLNDVITEWATEKMELAPAPLYIVLLNHGEDGRFHMYPDELTPEELDGMLDSLQDGLSGLAKEQSIVVVLGMCFSGSFIPAVSGVNRVVITAAARDEFSIRGPGDDGERQGEQFVYQLFRELRKGKSILESFQTSRQAVRSLSADRLLAVNSENPTFPGEKGQHPLLDDNGDGRGSSLVPSTLGDGTVAAEIALTSPVNALLGVDIARTNPAQFLSPIPENDSELALPALWAEVLAEPVDVLSIWMEVKTLADDDNVDQDSTMQHALVLTKEPMDIEVANGAVRSQWPRTGVDPNPNNLFTKEGKHQVFYFAASTNERAEISEPAVTWVYRASGKFSPSEFKLLLPNNNATVDFNPETPDSSGVFTWDESQSSGGPIEYFFRIWSDPERTELVLESEPLISPQTFLRPEMIEDGATYWWDVVAVDAEGNSTTSNELFRFTVDNLNHPAVWTTVFLVDKTSNEPIPSGSVMVLGINEVMIGSLGRHIKLLPAGTYSFVGSSDRYLESTITREVQATSTPVVIELELTRLDVGIHLNPGWNLLSVPVTQSDSSLETLISTNGKLSSVFDSMAWRWDGAAFREMTEIVPGYGFWLMSPVETFIETVGSNPIPLTQFYEQGWQLIGVKGTKALPATDNLNTRGNIWAWDSLHQRYYLIRNNTQNTEPGDELIPGRGYWVYFNSPGTVELGVE